MVEAILVLILVVEYSVVPYLGGAIEVERIVRQDHSENNNLLVRTQSLDLMAVCRSQAFFGQNRSRTFWSASANSFE